MIATLLDRRTLQERAFLALRSRIINGELLPGARIVEAEESARLGVSRGTLREALRELEQLGLVVRDPRRVVTVRKLSRKEVVELYAVRGALELLAAQTICELSDSRRRHATAELRACAEELVSAEADGDAEKRIHADLGFHEKLCELSQNTMLISQWRQLAGMIRVMLTSGHQRLSSDWSRASETIPEHHMKAVAALERADLPLVSQILLEGFRRSSASLAKPTRDAVSAS
jgi:DNA-binding GntR family transcriptional regulator